MKRLSDWSSLFFLSAKPAIADKIYLPAIGQTIYCKHIETDSRETSIKIRDNTFIINGKIKTSAEQEQLLIQGLKPYAKKIFLQHCEKKAAEIKVSFNRVTVRYQKKRWGSCSSKGNINLNVALLFVPPDYLDYVIIHELIHRVHFNHSADFWQMMEKFLPGSRVLANKIRRLSPQQIIQQAL